MHTDAAVAAAAAAAAAYHQHSAFAPGNDCSIVCDGELVPPRWSGSQASLLGWTTAAPDVNTITLSPSPTPRPWLVPVLPAVQVAGRPPAAEATAAENAGGVDSASSPLIQGGHHTG